jgi:hypothetical protein
MNAHEIMLSKGWKYYPGSGYCMKADGYKTWIPTKSIEEYVRDNYPKEYAEMSLKEDFKALTVRVDVLEQKDFMGGEPHKGRTSYDDTLEAVIKSLQAKCRGLDADLAQQRKSASSYIKTCHAKIKDLEIKLAGEKQVSWGASYSDMTQRVLDLEELTTKADKCVVKQGAKIKDQNNTIDRLKADQRCHRSTIKYLDGGIKRRNVKIIRAKELFKLVLSFGLTPRLRNSIKEELQ